MVPHTRCLHIYAESAAPSRNWLYAKQPYENPLCFVYFKVRRAQNTPFLKAQSALTLMPVQRHARNSCQGIPQLRNVGINITTTLQIFTNDAVVRTRVTSRGSRGVRYVDSLVNKTSALIIDSPRHPGSVSVFCVSARNSNHLHCRLRSRKSFVFLGSTFFSEFLSILFYFLFHCIRSVVLYVEAVISWHSVL